MGDTYSRFASHDIINISNGKIYELKSTIMEPTRKDASSFSPDNKSDYLCFLEIDINELTYKLYGPHDYKIVDDLHVNKKETFNTQQKSRRRPRGSLRELLQRKNLYKPDKAGYIKDILSIDRNITKLKLDNTYLTTEEINNLNSIIENIQRNI